MAVNPEYRELFGTFRKSATTRNIDMDNIAQQSSNGLSRLIREWNYNRAHSEDGGKLKEIPRKLATIAFGF